MNPGLQPHVRSDTGLSAAPPVGNGGAHVADAALTALEKTVTGGAFKTVVTSVVDAGRVVGVPEIMVSSAATVETRAVVKGSYVAVSSRVTVTTSVVSFRVTVLLTGMRIFAVSWSDAAFTVSVCLGTNRTSFANTTELVNRALTLNSVLVDNILHQYSTRRATSELGIVR